MTAEGSEEVLLVQQESLAQELPVYEPTGDPLVDAALDGLAILADRSLAEHVAVFDEVYRELHGRLSTLASGT